MTYGPPFIALLQAWQPRPGVAICSMPMRCGPTSSGTNRIGLDVGLLRFGRQDPAAVGDEPIPYDTSLDAVATSRRLGMPLLGIRELLTRFREDYAARP